MNFYTSNVTWFSLFDKEYTGKRRQIQTVQTDGVMSFNFSRLSRKSYLYLICLARLQMNEILMKDLPPIDQWAIISSLAVW